MLYLFVIIDYIGTAPQGKTSAALKLTFDLFRLRSDELDDAHLSCVSSAGTCFDYAGITAVNVLILRADFVEELLNNVLFGDVCKSLTLIVKSCFLAESNHFLGH